MAIGIGMQGLDGGALGRRIQQRVGAATQGLAQGITGHGCGGGTAQAPGSTATAQAREGARTSGAMRAASAPGTGTGGAQAARLGGSNPRLAAAAKTLGSVEIGRESLRRLEQIGAPVHVVSDAQYDAQYGASVGRAVTTQRGGSFSSVIYLRESALQDPRKGAALLAHEIEHAWLKHQSGTLRDGDEADAERREAAVKVALGMDPVAGNS